MSMFEIPSRYRLNLPLDEALEIMGRKPGGTEKSCNKILNLWDDCITGRANMTEAEFFEIFQWEVNALVVLMSEAPPGTKYH